MTAFTPQATQDLFMIDGMFCAGCAASLEKRLGALQGVEDVAVDLAAGAALLRWAPGKKNVKAVAQTADALGYSARHPDTPASLSGSPDPGRKLQFRLAIALFFGMWTMLPSIALYLNAAPTPEFANLLAWSAAVASSPVVIFAGLPFYAMAVKTLRAGVAGMDALVSLGVLGALALSALSLAQAGADVYFEVAVALITLQLLARLIQFNVARTGRDALARLIDLTPSRVLRIDAHGRAEMLAVSGIEAGDVLIAEPGETLALDGVVEYGEARLGRHLLTGESQAVRVTSGDSVYAGEIVIEGPLRMSVEALSGKRRIDALAQQVRTLLMRKPDWQRSVDIVARHFLFLAAIAAGVGALLAAFSGADAMGIAERALAVFVIACPCALSLAAPLAGLSATRRAVDAEILLRDFGVFSRAPRINAVFLDKTGTLTEGRPTVESLNPSTGVEERELLSVAAFVEQQSRHPFAIAIVHAASMADCHKDIENRVGTDAAHAAQRRTSVGNGVSAEVAGMMLRVGSAEWFAREDLVCPSAAGGEFSRVWVARDEQILGTIDLDDRLRDGAMGAITELKRRGFAIKVLSGDAEEPVARVCKQLGIEGVARCSPEEKVAQVEWASETGSGTAFIGDGLNDGPAIAAADLGVAIEDALDNARTASAATLLRGGVERLPQLLAIVASAGRVLRQNVCFAIIYNAVAVPAAILGWVHPAVAAVAMAASSITIVVNSLRVSSQG